MLAGLLLLAAYALFLPTLSGKPGDSGLDRQKLNLALHRQRRTELADEASGSELAGLQAELDQDLLGDLAATAHAAAQPSAQGRAGVLLALIAAPLLGVLVYSQLGRLDLLDVRPEPPAASAEVTPEIQAMIDRLADKMRQNPGDLRGWLLLGRSYQQIERYDQAVDAYAHAQQLAADNLDVQAFYAQAVGQAQGGDFTGEPAQTAAAILAKNPKHHTALWLAGVAAAQQGDAAAAIRHLQTLRDEFPADSPEGQHLDKLLADIKATPAPEQNPAALPATGEQKSIRVNVTLSAALKAKAAADDTVFIFARAAAGPPMPLAIVRKHVKDLPLEVTLDDTMGMVQGMNLSAFDQLVIGARISKSGQALPKPGDLQGLNPPTTVENGGQYAVEIAEEIK